MINPSTLENSIKTTNERPTLVIRQTDRDLAERIREGENIYSVIHSVLKDDSTTMAEYWERSLLKKDTALVLQTVDI